MSENAGKGRNGSMWTSCLSVVALVLGGTGCADAGGTSLDDQWVRWCLDAKQELIANDNFAPKAVFVEEPLVSQAVFTANFDGLLFPVPQEAILDLRTIDNSEGRHQLILELESGLSIRADRFQREPLEDVLGYFGVALPARVQTYVDE